MAKLLHFIKYNNATVIILAIILILGGGALAAGPENIGQKETSIQGIDNTTLILADLGKFNMDFKIENIEQDDNYYYVTYSYLDLVIINSAWQYQLSQTTRKVSKKIKDDVGVYMAKYLAKQYEARLRELTQAKTDAESQGEQKRVEITEYSGLVGRTLDLAAKFFPGYEPVVKQELPSPEFNPPALAAEASQASGSDNLNKIYNDYVEAHPDLFTSPAEETASSSPDQDQPETPSPDLPETTTAPEATSVEIIELPVPPPAEPEQTPPATEEEPAPQEDSAPAPDLAPAPDAAQ